MKITKWMRILLVCLSFVMALSLFSCKTEEQPPATSEEQTTTGTQEGSTTKETVDSTEATEATTEATDTTGTETETTGTETATSDTEATDTSDTEATDTSDTETTESSETETTETEETECQHEDKEEVAAKAANCKKGGNEAYVICNACGVMWNTDGAVIEAIPETPIDPDVHLAKEEVPAKLPTTKEEGNAAYSECRGCRKYWNADGEEITEDQIVKYPVIVPTTEKYWGVAELDGIVISGATGSKFEVPAASADKSYVRFARAGASEDGNISLITTAEGTEATVTGQYFIIKYRTDSAAYITIWADTEDGSITGGENAGIPGISPDGEWHIIVLDLSKNNGKTVKEKDGTYTIQALRLDVLDQKADAGYVDIAYMAVADDLADFAGIMQDGDEYLCSHIKPENPTYVDCGSEHYYTCAICSGEIYESHYIIGTPSWDADNLVYSGTCACEAAVEQDMLHYAEPIIISQQAVTGIQEDGFMRYYPGGEASTDRYVQIYKSGTAVTGRYAVIKYRAFDPNASSLPIGNYYAGSAMSGKDSAHGDGDGIGSSFGAFIADGEWHYQIIYITDEMVNRTQGHLALNDDDTFTWKYLRITFHASVFDGSAYLDIDTIAFADREEAVNNYIFKDTPGNTEENPIFVEDPANTTIKVGAGKTAYVQAYCSGMIFTLTGDASVEFDGTTYTAVDGKVEFLVPAPDMVGRAPASMFAITNNGAEDATYTLSFAWPKGHMENPEDLVDGDNVVNIEAGNDQGYFFEWTAPYDGTLTLKFDSDAGWIYSISNMTTCQYGDICYSDDDPVVDTVELTVKEGDVIQIMVNTYDPEAPWEAPEGAVAVEATFAAALGTEGNPILFESETNTITVPAGATVYYQAYCAGMVFTLAGDATVGFNGETYTAADGKVEFLVPAPTMMGRVPPSVFAITNNGEADAEYTVVFTYPVGSMQNPAAAVEGDNTASIEAGNTQGYFFTITAPEDGILVTAISSTTGWTYCINNMTSNKYGDNITSEGGSATAKTAVKAGDVIQIMVNTLNPADPWNIPAGDITLNISFTDCDHENKGELTAKVDATCTEDGCEAYYVCADCGKYLNENEVVIEAPVVIPAGHKMVNVEAKAPTCTEAGNAAYSYCSVCDKKFAADGAEITEIPTIPATNHEGTVTEYEKKYATTQEKGNEKYSACGACGVMWNADGEVITSVPELELLAPTANYYFGAAELENIKIDGTTGMKAVVSADRSYVSFNRAKEGGDGNITLIVDDASIEKVSGKYFVIKYRTTSEKYIQAWFSTTGFDASAHKDFNIINDGEWHILVIDIAAFNSANVVADDNGNYILKWARLDILDANATEGGIDIAYTAIADDLAKFATVTQEGDDKICDHNATITAPVWNETNKNYDINCICGATTKDYLYKTESNLTANTKSLSVTVMDGFVRYTAIGTSDPYFFPIADNTTYVTGNYLVIKYRLVNNNQDSGVGQRFAASALSENNTAKANGDQKGIITYGNLIGNGEWHYYVVAIDLASTDPNTQFIANEDGTYTWKYLRLTFASPAATDGSCYLDIDYLMFADHLEQFDELIYNDLYKDNIPFRPNVDGTNNSINGEAFTTSIQKDGTIEFDLDGKTVNDPTEGFMLGGWLCTPGGIESYKIRVTKVDGVAVAAPVLVDWQTGANALDIYKAVGKPRNYSISSAYNARFNKMAINLAAYAGQKIDFEVVAITNFGEELTIIKVNNLTVAEFECPHSEFTNVDAKAPTCTEAGYEAYKVCKTCSQKFTMEGEELDAPVAIPAAHKYVEHAEVASTCTVAGTGFYKSCEGCDKLFNAENAEITEIPALPLAEHTLEEVAAKAATCEEAGYEAYKACSVCSKKFSMEGAEIEAPTAIPASHKYVEHAEVPSTCKVAGTGFYKSCENCNKLFNAENAVIDAIPALPLSTTHSYVTVEAKDPTCTEAGNAAYSYCSVCDKKLAANGAEITEIPTIPATNHEGKVTVYEKKYATTQEKGNEKYSACGACGAMWNADGGVITSVPEIAVIVPTTEVYLGAAELSGLAVNGVTGSLFAVPAMSDDRSYVRFARAGSSNDGNVVFLSENTDETGKYLIFKYRTDNQASVQVWANTTGGVHGSANFYYNTITDGNWHIAIIDLSASISGYVKADDNGNYTIQWARIDILDGSKESGYFDLAYVAYADDPADFAGIIQEGDKALCTHIIAANPVYANLGDNHSTECAICGETMFFNHAITNATWNIEELKYFGNCQCGANLEQEAIYTAEANGSGAHSSFKATTTDGVVRYTCTGTDDPYIHVYVNGAEITGKFAVIKYRTTVEGANFSGSYVGSVKGNHATASSGCDSNSGLGYQNSLVADGEWHYVIVEAKSDCFKPNADGTYSYRFIRLNLRGFAVDQYIEVDEIAFVDNHYAAQVYVNGKEVACEHYSNNSVWLADSQEYVTTCIGCGHEMYRGECPHGSTTIYVWNSETKLYEATCNACNELLTKDMLYKTEGTSTAETTESSGGFLTVEQMGDVVRYTPAATASDPFFYPLRHNNSNVTGQYVVIKYRLVNNNTDMTVGAIYASSSAHGRATAAGADGDGNNHCVNSTTLTADGEWHYLIITPKDTNKTFKANADGTYTWKYLRIQINGFAAIDGSCYIEIDELAFADNLYAVERYAKGDEAVCSHANKGYVWDNVNGYTTVCEGCGLETVIGDMIYKTEANLGAADGNGTHYAGSMSNFLTVTQEDGFVRYTPNKTIPSDCYFFPFTGNTTIVTGQYMVIKYRAVNNGKNMTASIPFASSAASGQTSAKGSNGDNSNTFVNGDTLYADGEWHYLVITPGSGNATFIKNIDGTYTWSYLRVRFGGLDATDGSCYFDIDEIAFADNMDAVNAYIGQ